MDFIVENALEKREEIKETSNVKIKEPKVFLVETDGKKGYITEEQFIIAQKQGKDIKKIRELNI